MVPWLPSYMTRCSSHVISSAFSWPNFRQTSLLSLSPWTLLTLKLEQVQESQRCHFTSSPEKWLIEPGTIPVISYWSFSHVCPTSPYIAYYFLLKDLSVWFWEISNIKSVLSIVFPIILSLPKSGFAFIWQTQQMLL